MNTDTTDNSQLVQKIDSCLTHVWMVRAFLKHCEEAEDDDELRSVHRDLYDFMLALGPPLTSGDHDKYIKQARKKLKKLISSKNLFLEIQPEISSHTNFQMAAQSLSLAVSEIERLLKENE